MVSPVIIPPNKRIAHQGLILFRLGHGELGEFASCYLDFKARATAIADFDQDLSVRVFLRIRGGTS
jgi:hypothetical protein